KPLAEMNTMKRVVAMPAPMDREIEGSRANVATLEEGDVGPTLVPPANSTPLSLIVLATLASAGAVWLARPVLVPMVLGMLISAALAPLQRRLVKWRIPPSLAAAAILLTLITGGIGLAYALADQATAFVADIPRVARQIKSAVERSRRTGPSALEQVQAAANELK